MVRHPVGLASLLTALAAVGAAPPEPAREEVHRYEVTAKALADFTAQGMKGTSEAEVRQTYRHKTRGRELTVTCDSYRAAITINGDRYLFLDLDAETFAYARGKAPAEKGGIDAAPEPFRSAAKATFGAALCRLTLDADGKELKRELLAKREAAPLVDSGLVENGLMFHPPFYADKATWEAEPSVKTGAAALKGVLVYEQGPRKGDLVTVRVSGAMKPAGDAKAKTPYEFTDGKYEVAGEQTYDVVKRRWVSGKLRFVITGNLKDGDKEVGQSRTTMDVEMKALPNN